MHNVDETEHQLVNTNCNKLVRVPHYTSKKKKQTQSLRK